MTLKEAKTKIANDVYKAALLIEELEHKGLVSGNGHHAAQKIAAFAEADLDKRWIGPRDEDGL